MLIVGISSPFRQSGEELKTDDPNRIKINLRHEPGMADPNLNQVKNMLIVNEGPGVSEQNMLASQTFHASNLHEKRGCTASSPPHAECDTHDPRPECGNIPRRLESNARSG